MDDGDQSKKKRSIAVKEFACMEVWKESEKLHFDYDHRRRMKNVKQWNQERCESELSLHVSRTDVVVEDGHDEFAGHQIPSFVFTRNRASFYWRQSRPHRLQRESNYLLL